MSDAVPALQGLHPMAVSTKSASLYLPAGHRVQPSEPGAAQEPTTQSSHAVLFALGKVPLPHWSQVEAPGGAAVPGAQGLGRPVPLLGQLAPAVQIIGSREPRGQKVPIGHSAEQRGADKAGVLPYEPVGHGVSSGLASMQNDAAGHGAQDSPPPGDEVPGGQL